MSLEHELSQLERDWQMYDELIAREDRIIKRAAKAGVNKANYLIERDEVVAKWRELRSKEGEPIVNPNAS